MFNFDRLSVQAIASQRNIKENECHYTKEPLSLVHSDMKGSPEHMYLGGPVLLIAIQCHLAKCGI
jgi:hypothetical protein